MWVLEYFWYDLLEFCYYLALESFQNLVFRILTLEVKGFFWMKILLIFIAFLWGFCCFYYRNSFFYLLVIFEGVSLTIFLLLSFYLSLFGASFDSIILFLSFIVIEGGFGLGLLIFIISRSGDDKILGMSFSTF